MNLKEAISHEFNDVKRRRDELRVQAHLARADAKDALDRIESRWPELERKLKELEQSSSKAVDEIAKSARRLIDEIKADFEALRGEPRS
jgi:hypothetical protein